jgi:nucleoid DNA-binding protein
MEITKKDVVNLVKAKTDLSVKTTSEVVDALLEVITEALADGDSVRFTGFGTFSVTERAARTGKNPRTGEVIEIAASKSVSFKAGKSLKDKVNG